MSDRHGVLLEGARGAVDRALRRRRIAAGLLAGGLATVGLASPVAGQAPEGGDAPVGDDATPTTGTDPFDAGSETVPAEQVSGDTTATTVAAAEAPSDDGSFATEEVKAEGDGEVSAAGTGGVSLTDGNGFAWFVNTDIGFATSSSASAGVSEASMTASEPGVSTLNGGTTSSSLGDGFDGYQSLCLDLGADAGDGGAAQCDTGNASMAMYNELGPFVGLECSDREVVFPVSTAAAGFSVQRRVYVPDDAGAGFARWTNTVTNTSGASETLRITTGNNLGSDSSTVIVTSSSGDAAVSDGELWATTFQAFSGTTSSDPRIGHVFGGAGASVPAEQVVFANSDDNPHWSYDLTLAPGETAIVVNYATLAKTQAAAASAAAALAAGTTAHQWDCMTDDERNQIVNFANRAADDPATNDPASPPTASFAGATSTATEGTTAQVTVLRAGNVDEARTFAVSIAGTATGGTDYTVPAGTVAFAAGEASKAISIPIATDATADAGETIVLVLSDPNAPSDPTVTLPVPAGVSTAALGATTTHVVTLLDPAQVTTTTTPTTQPQALARTGSEVAGLLQLAGGSMAAGGAAVIAGDLRRRFRFRRRSG